jgi:hypothetical protein
VLSGKLIWKRLKDSVDRWWCGLAAEQLGKGGDRTPVVRLTVAVKGAASGARGSRMLFL